ncbi:MAG: 50S ribosomal protein L9 [Sedimentisphaerales bacterium]|nr:50S ribosomal protein L9 [Sedimentisphaerales bacterium]
MKVLLVSDIEQLGWYGDVVQVNSGYARNYLFPQKLALDVTETNAKSIAAEKARRQGHRKKDRQRLEEAAHSANGAEVVIASRANEMGHLFGSVGPHEIAENLVKQGFEVTEEFVQLPERIKQVGSSEVILRFAENLTAAITVVVVAEQKELSESEEKQ